MRKLKSRWFLALCAVCWAACTALLLHITQVRSGSIDEMYGWWRYLRIASQALAITTVLGASFLLVSYRRKLTGFLPAFWKYRPLLALLVRRDFLVKYKRSVLGVVWTLLSPLANMVILSIVFSSLFRVAIPFFPAYVLSGSLVFACFGEATQGALGSVIAKANFIRKVYVPKYIFPLSNTIGGFITLFFSLAALLLVMLVIGAPFRVTMLAAPVVIVYLFVFCAGTGLLLSTAFVFFRDTAHIFTVLLTALNYLSAIFFDVAIVPEKYMAIFALNPMYHYIRVFRQAMLYGTWPSGIDHLICGGIAVIALCAGIFVFYRNQDKFILYV